MSRLPSLPRGYETSTASCRRSTLARNVPSSGRRRAGISSLRGRYSGKTYNTSHASSSRPSARDTGRYSDYTNTDIKKLKGNSSAPLAAQFSRLGLTSGDRPSARSARARPGDTARGEKERIITRLRLLFRRNDPEKLKDFDHRIRKYEKKNALPRLLKKYEDFYASANPAARSTQDTGLRSARRPAEKKGSHAAYCGVRGAGTALAELSRQTSRDEDSVGEPINSSRRRLETRSPSGQIRMAVGLTNLGNTCYMNSALQCVCSTPALIRYFRNDTWRGDINRKRSSMKGRLAKAFGELMVQLSTQSTCVRPQKVKEVIGRLAPQFAGYRQHDCHELIRFLLDGLHEELNRIKEMPPYEQIEDGERDSDDVISKRWWRNYTQRNDSVLVDTFAGQLKSCVKCGKCGHVSTVFDPFWDLSLPIPEKYHAKRSYSYYSSSSAADECSLKECFEEFAKADDVDEYYCRKCKKHRRSTKQLSVWRFPKVLVFHLKRFSFSGYSRSKINTAVSAPSRLSLSDLRALSKERADRGTGYALYAIGNHMGTCGGGHYIAHANIG